MNNILDFEFIKEFIKATKRLDSKGWHESNSGNMSYILKDEEASFFHAFKSIKNIPLTIEIKNLANKYLLVTASGSYIKNIEYSVSKNAGIIKVDNEGKSVDIVWGFETNLKPTSELSTHLLSHNQRLEVDINHRVIIHTHATHINALSYVHELDDKKITKTLWQMTTESIVLFPDGISVLPWMICGSDEIGLETKEKMKTQRIVIWAMHGVFGAGKSFDEVCGLVETVDKAAEIYLLTLNNKINTITDDQLVSLAERFNANYKKEYFK